VLEMAGAIPIPECTVLHEPMGGDGAVLLHLFEDAPRVPKVVRGVEVPKDVLEMEVVIPTPEYTRALGLSEEPKEVLDEAPQVPRYLLCMEMLQGVLEMDGGLPIPDFTGALSFSEVPKCVLEDAPQVTRDVLAMAAPGYVLEMEDAIPIPESSGALSASAVPKSVLEGAPQVPQDVQEDGPQTPRGVLAVMVFHWGEYLFWELLAPSLVF